MARLISLLEQHLDRQPPTVVTQATTWWETVLALVKLQECGLGVHLPVKVCVYVSTCVLSGGAPTPAGTSMFLYVEIFCTQIQYESETKGTPECGIT